MIMGPMTRKHWLNGVFSYQFYGGFYGSSHINYMGLSIRKHRRSPSHGKMISSNINYMGCSIVMGVAQNVWLRENPITMDDDWC